MTKVDVLGKYNLPSGLTIVIPFPHDNNLGQYITDGENKYRILQLVQGNSTEQLSLLVEIIA